MSILGIRHRKLNKCRLTDIDLGSFVQKWSTDWPSGSKKCFKNVYQLSLSKSTVNIYCRCLTFAHHWYRVGCFFLLLRTDSLRWRTDVHRFFAPKNWCAQVLCDQELLRTDSLRSRTCAQILCAEELMRMDSYVQLALICIDLMRNTHWCSLNLCYGHMTNRTITLGEVEKKKPSELQNQGLGWGWFLDKPQTKNAHATAPFMSLRPTYYT